MPAKLSSLYYKLPWQWAITFTAPPGRLQEYFRQWADAGGDWDDVYHDQSDHPKYRPFWLTTLVSPAKDGGPHVFYKGVIHAHIILGGIPSYQEIRHLVSLWPAKASLKRIRGPLDAWGWLHYILSQQKITRDDPFVHARDIDSYCHNLLCSQLESDNLEYILQRHRHRLFAKAGKRSGAGQGRLWRVARARRAAAARWGDV